VGPSLDRTNALPRPRKFLGQVFLVERSLLIPSLAFLSNPSRRPPILEIGPGLGQATRPLLETGSEVVALEVDSRFSPALQSLAEEFPTFRFRIADAQTVSWDGVFPGIYSVFGNLPYFLSTAFLEHLLEREWHWQRAAFLLQREVSQRLLANPGEEGYGALSVLARFRARLSPGPFVPRQAFRPVPKVDSAFLHLERLPEPLFPVPDATRFTDLVRGAFGQRRKTLSNNLRRLHPELSRETVERILTKAGIDPRRRGETLSPQEFARLAWILEESG
jgi:16S rRNA (adenine1518-N6/adenine1519-N6)-dimethyltransferase